MRKHIQLKGNHSNHKCFSFPPDACRKEKQEVNWLWQCKTPSWDPADFSHEEWEEDIKSMSVFMAFETFWIQFVTANKNGKYGILWSELLLQLLCHICVCVGRRGLEKGPKGFWWSQRWPSGWAAHTLG